MKKFLLIPVMLLLCVFATSGQNTSEKQELKQRLEEEIQFINNQLRSNASRQKASVQQLGLIRKKVSNRKQLIDEADRNIKRIQGQIEESNRRIATLERELDTLEKHYSKLLYSCYKNRDSKLWFMYLLSGESIGQGYRRFVYMKNMAAAISDKGVEIKESRTRIEKEKASLELLAAEAKALKKEREKEYKSLVEEENQSKSMVNALSREKKKYTAELAKKKAQVERLNKEIERVVNKAVKDQPKAEVDQALSGVFEQNKGKLPWPVKGVITEHFGKNTHPVYKNIQLPVSNGVSITATKGAEVKCVFDGVVKQILLMPGYNQCVLVQHGTYFTFYCKLSSVNVKNGQQVATGQPLGTLEESDGASVLHFQIWKGTVKQNPEQWLK
ncbi:MAG: peptidoglycan DD-metalloendopeptidase family protein [Bacteroidales bacterium]|nr:peptidoglycan DD-metalloendopeptidase family protein [Bacteroidales bacterium]